MGCGEVAPAPPRPGAVVPAAGWSGAAQPIAVEGEGFLVKVVRRLRDEPFETDASFRAWLGEAELSDVRYLDGRTLSAEVPPGLAPGRYGLTVRDPYGNEGLLPEAFLVFAERPAALLAAIAVDPPQVRIGDTATVTLTITNTGETEARDLEATLLSSGDGSVEGVAEPAPLSEPLQGGQSIVQARTVRAVAPGEVRFEAQARAVEQHTGAELVAGAGPSDPLSVVECLLDAECDDGLDCTGVETCAAGACVPGAPPCADDGLACTATCDEASLTCDVLLPGSCLIGGTCRAAGEADPLNPCRACDPASSPSTWTDADGSACDDGSFCNGVDACLSGACVPSGIAPCTDDGLSCTTTCDEAADACNVIDAGFCAIAGSCYAAGTPNPANPCEECGPAAATAWTSDDSNACDDGLYCNGPDACLAGVCLPAGPDPCAADAFSCTNACDEAADGCVVDAGACLVDGACRAAGEIDPQNPCRECVPAASQTTFTADDTNACGDGLFCNGVESCVSGACMAGEDPCPDDGFACTVCDETADLCNVTDPASCLIGGSCYGAGAPNPLNGCQECDPTATQSFWTGDDTNSCDDGHACTTGDACDGGACGGAWVCAIDLPPAARFTVTPRSGTTATLFTVDASGSSDLEDPPAALQFRWDWEADGIWDTAFSGSAVDTHAFPAVPPGGLSSIALEVRDSAGLGSVATQVIALSDIADEVLVTTEADEGDPGATPASPGGTGLSLREAIAYANATAGAQVISFDPALSGPLVLLSTLPGLTGTGEVIAGRPGLALDGSALFGSADCLTLAGSGQTALALEAAGCPASGIEVYGSGNRVIGCTVWQTTYGIVTWDGTGHVVADNEAFSNSYSGLAVWGTATVERNLVHDNFYGIDHGYTSGQGSVLRRNLVWNNGDAGIQIYSNADGVVVVHNTVQGNGGDGISLAPNIDGVDLRNNLLTGNAGYGLRAGGAALTAFASNDYFGNALGSCMGTACPSEAAPFAFDPRYADPAADLRLLPGSPAVDLALDLGLDLNGVEPGLFHGAAPDLGAWEAPAGF